jgi:hypothetical protein
MADYRSVLFKVPAAQRLADLTGVHSDLSAAEDLCARFLAEETNGPGDNLLLEALCAAAIVRYGRTFPSGARDGVPRKLIESMGPDVVVTHDYFKNLRDKWIAHSVNAFEENDVAAWLMPVDRGPPGVTSISVREHRVVCLGTAGVQALKDLCAKLRERISEELATENGIVLRLAQSLPPEPFYSQVDPMADIHPEPGKTRSRY